MRLIPHILGHLHRLHSPNIGIKLNNLLYTQFRKCSTYDLNLKINDVNVDKYVQRLEKEYKNLNKGQDDYRSRHLQQIMNVLKKRKDIVENLKNICDILKEKDEELSKLAAEEKEVYEQELETVDERLKEVILPDLEGDDCTSIVLEVNAGVGGQEAMLFASELFEMYSNFAAYKNFEVFTAEYLTSDLGGLRHGVLFIKGNKVFSYFKYEAGVHRVQRIPETEKAGRIHTSTVSVNTLPQSSDIQVNIQSKDLRIDTKRATGAGGQHVNTTDSAVRITHIPTNISIECQVDRSQIKNRQIAMERLRAKLFQMQLDQQIAETTATRKQQVRSNFRNEKIRTYNFGQDRITDHRIQGNVHNLKVFMMGQEPLNVLVERLHRQAQIEDLLEAANELNTNKS